MSQENKKITLNIGGMSCVNCAHAIEKALSKLNGVTRATVNLPRQILLFLRSRMQEILQIKPTKIHRR